ncbi:MAG: hypothetical protein ACFB15_12860 [Cyclobacteriaceae bacterium]|mgnify:CR=1 FL=1
MKKLALLIFVSFTSFNDIYAQNESVIVSGTRVFMIPPEGFSSGKNFLGFQKGDEALINIMDLNGGNFYTNTATFDRDKFEAGGITVFDFREMTIDGYPAKYVVMQGEPTVITVNLVFGDSTFSTMITGMYPVHDESLGNEVKQSILSASYNKDVVVDPFVSTFFSLDDTETDLKFSQSSANMFIYTIDGQTENNENKPMMLVIPLPNDDTLTPKQTSEQMMTSLQGKGLESVEYISNSDSAINGYKAYELIAKGKMNGVEANVFIQTIVNGENQVIIQGIHEGGDFNPESFRKLSSTVQID